MKYHQRLKDIREDHDYVQKEIAAILRITQQQYALYEQGIRQMPIEHYKVLATHYQCSIDYLSGLCTAPTAPGGGPYNINKKITITQKGNGNKINFMR